MDREVIAHPYNVGGAGYTRLVKKRRDFRKEMEGTFLQKQAAKKTLEGTFFQNKNAALDLAEENGRQSRLTETTKGVQKRLTSKDEAGYDLTRQKEANKPGLARIAMETPYTEALTESEIEKTDTQRLLNMATLDELAMDAGQGTGPVSGLAVPNLSNSQYQQLLQSAAEKNKKRKPRNTLMAELEYLS